MSAFSLFGGRFDRDAADCAWTERDGPDGPDGPPCPFCGRPTRVRRDGSMACDDCEMEWADVDEMAVDREAVRPWLEVDDES